MTLEEKVMFNVLRAISKGETGSAQAPDEAYLKALDTLGFIKNGWDTTLTPFGQKLYDQLINSQW